MNIKFLVCASFLIALLSHLAIFNLFTFVFPIEDGAPKPKFFFLGPILTQKDVKEISSEVYGSQIPNNTKNFDFSDIGLSQGQLADTDQNSNPFAIRTINKPLVPQTADSQDKVVIKSTFETQFEVESTAEEELPKRLDPDIKIRPYEPLQFRSPNKKTPK